MGMCIVGRDPDAEVGEVYEANIAGYDLIYNLTVETCDDLIDCETLQNMAANKGAGPEEQAVCTEMAARILEWTKEHPSDDDDIYKEWIAFLRHCGGFQVF